jgi:phage shock protein A
VQSHDTTLSLTTASEVSQTSLQEKIAQVQKSVDGLKLDLAQLRRHVHILWARAKGARVVTHA